MSAFTDAYSKDMDEADKAALWAAHARSRPDDIHPDLREAGTVRRLPDVCMIPGCGCTGYEHA